MGTNTTLERGRTYVDRHPGRVLLGVVAAYLLLDLIAKLLFFDLHIGPVRVFGGTRPISSLFTFLWDGIVIGLAIGLAGIGLSMTYSILGFANFSHGDYVTSGAFAGWAVAFAISGLAQGDLGYLLLIGPQGGQGPSPGQLGINVLGNPVAVVAGLFVAAAVTILVALALDRVVYKPMREQGAISLLIASIGVALAVRYMIVFVFGGNRRGLTAGPGGQLILGGVDGKLAITNSRGALIRAQAGNPPTDEFFFELPVLDFGSYSNEIIAVTGHEATLVVASLVLMYGLHLLMQRTKLGKSMRAMADNKDLARVTGIPTERVIRDTWIIGSGLAGAAGFLLALESGTLSFSLGWTLLLLIFAAVILGGIGSVYGAMVGGVVIGVASRIALVWLPSDFATAAAFLLMIFMLVLRPEGLFGGVTTA
jgi:branched-chain amino acid transport system permease protein